MQTAEEKRNDWLESLKVIYEQQSFEIEGVEFELKRVKHKERLKVFAFFSQYQMKIAANHFDFFDTPEFAAVMSLIEGLVTVDGLELSKFKVEEDGERKGYWDLNPQNYIRFVKVTISVFSYPFLQGLSQS